MDVSPQDVFSLITDVVGFVVVVWVGHLVMSVYIRVITHQQIKLEEEEEEEEEFYLP